MEEVDTVLDSKFIDWLIDTCKLRLVNTGWFPPGLFMTFIDGTHDITNIPEVETHEERCLALHLIKARCSAAGKIIEEAMMVSDTWYVEEPTTKPIDRENFVPPSERPDRREAIVVAGRNSAGTKVVYVLLPYTRLGQNQFSFGKPMRTGDDGGKMTTYLLNTLFDEAKQ